MRYSHLLLLFIPLLFACGEATKQLPPHQFIYRTAEETGVFFQNEVNETVHRNIGTFDYMYNGAGVAIVDLNQDGLPDLVFCGNDVPSAIYRNKGNLQFEEVTEGSGVEHDGWTTGVTVVDINEDGLPDLFFSRSGPDYKSHSTANLLYINQGDFRFIEEGKKRGLKDEGLSTQALFFDVDRDLDLDLLVLNHAERNWANLAPEWFSMNSRVSPEEQQRYTNALYINNGEGQFKKDPSAFNQMGFSLSAALSDFNGTGNPSLFIANDYFVPDQLLNINQAGKFTNSIQQKFSHISYYSMGSDAADFNNDGRIDLMVPDMSPNDHYRSKTLMASMDTATFRYLERRRFVPQYMFNGCYVNSGDGVMSDIAHLAGVAQTDWSWAPLLVDLDNDGLKDLYITNGVYRDVTNNDWRKPIITAIRNDSLSPQMYFDHLQKAPRSPLVNAAFQNLNGMQFGPVTSWGLDSTSFSNGLAAGDLDGDGDVDLVTNNLGQPAFVIENTSADRGAGFIRFKLNAPNHDGALVDGAKVSIWVQGKQQHAENRFTRGYLSYSEPILHFGLGHNPPETLDSVLIQWPNNEIQVVLNVKTNTVHEVFYKKAPIAKAIAEQTAYWDLTNLAFHVPIVHRENNFDDFKVEQLLPQRTSTMGPALAVGDVNGDQLPDFYLGGAKGEPGQLLIQNEGGYFGLQAVEAFQQAAEGEELGAEFLDIDGDGDLDLYIARGGGGEVQGRPNLLQDLLYENDGTGDFELLSDKLPRMETSTKAIAVFDWDEDGDLDLFVGGRNEPGKYPFGVRSYFLENNKGKFTDITEQMNSDFLVPQMITDACWIPRGENASIKLVVVGEWMRPKLFKSDRGKTEDVFLIEEDVPAFENLEGWWNSVDYFVFNNQPILVLGNLGLNNKFHVNQEHPLQLAAGDFDGNGTNDILLIKQYHEQLVPVRGLQCSSGQIPEIKERFATYDAFASADIFEVIGRDLTDEDELLRANTFESGWCTLGKDGVGPFNPFPIAAQSAPVMGAVAIGDDLILACNLFTTEIETTAYDAGKGTVLTARLNANGKLEFSVTESTKSGVFLASDVRQLVPITISLDQLSGAIMASNNGKVRLIITSSEEPVSNN